VTASQAAAAHLAGPVLAQHAGAVAGLGGATRMAWRRSSSAGRFTLKLEQARKAGVDGDRVAVPGSGRWRHPTAASGPRGRPPAHRCRTLEAPSGDQATESPVPLARFDRGRVGESISRMPGATDRGPTVADQTTTSPATTSPARMASSALLTLKHTLRTRAGPGEWVVVLMPLILQRTASGQGCPSGSRGAPGHHSGIRPGA